MPTLLENEVSVLINNCNLYICSDAEPKGSDCYEKFSVMQECMAQYPELYGKDDDDELAAAMGEAAAAEGPAAGGDAPPAAAQGAEAAAASD